LAGTLVFGAAQVGGQVLAGANGASVVATAVVATAAVLMEMEARTAVTVVRLTRSRNAAGELVVRPGVRLLDEYQEFLPGRCRPNTVLAVAYDLKAFLPW